MAPSFGLHVDVELELVAVGVLDVERVGDGVVRSTDDRDTCGFELPLVLVERDTSLDQRLEKNRQLSPERRARRLFTRLEKEGTEDG